MMRKVCFLCVLFFVVFNLGGWQCASAHKVKLFAAVEGATISGYAYYTSSARPKNVTVSLQGPDGKAFDTVQTNANGEFAIEARYRTDTMLHVDTGDGHSAQWLVAAEEFPADLAPYPAEKMPVADAALTDITEESPLPAVKGETETTLSAAELAHIVRKELAPLQKQVNILRQQLDLLEEKKRFQDILGGIGYLLGITGIACYVAARRRSRRP